MTSAEIKERIRFLEEMLKLLQSIVAFKTRDEAEIFATIQIRGRD